MKNERIKDLARGERIRKIRTGVLKLSSQEALAKSLTPVGVSVTRGAVGNWELGGEISLESMQALSTISGIPIDWIASGKMNENSQHNSNPYQFSSPKIDSPNARISSSISGHGVKIPVYGRAIGGIDGEFDMNGSLLGTILAPPKLAGMKDVYAVIVVGESMSPRYEDGETCVIDPHYRIKKGDYVVAQIKNEDEGPQLAYVKKFIRRNDIELVLEQFNPPKELHFPAKNVVSVHYISVSGNL